MEINLGQAGKRLQPQNGLTLIEVLITMFILSVGLTGLVMVQSISVLGTSHSHQRSIALVKVHDLLERIKSNPDADYSFPINEKGSTATLSELDIDSCTSSSCTADQLRNFQLAQWQKDTLTNGATAADTGKLNGLNAHIYTLNAEPRTYRVSIVWNSFGEDEQVGCGDDLVNIDTVGGEKLTCMQLDVRI